MDYYELTAVPQEKEVSGQSNLSEESINPRHPLPQEEPSWQQSLAVCLLTMAMMTLYCVAVVTSQVSGIETNIFQVNSLRYTVQCLGVAPLAFCHGTSLRIPRNDLYLIGGATISNIAYASSFYSAAVFMPVGNLSALFLAFYIMVSTAYDFVKGSITLKAVLTSIVAIFGILLLVQPWNRLYKDDRPKTQCSPCEYLDKSSGPNSTDISCEISDLQFSSAKNSTSHIKGTDNVVWQTFIGYVCIVLSAVACTAASNFEKSLVMVYPASPVIFWVTLLEGFLCFTINLVWTSVTEQSHYTFPSGRYCLFFLWLFILSSSFTNSLSYLTYRYLNVSTVALTTVFVAVFLYISQRTYLSAFHPGHANVTEILGIVIVISATALLPVMWLCSDRVRETNHDS